MKPGDLMRSRSPWVRLWDENQDDNIVIEVYPRKFELLLVLGGSRNRYYKWVLTSGGMVGYVLGSEITSV